MAKQVIDVELRPDPSGLRSLTSDIKEMRKELEEATDPKQVNKLNRALGETEEQIEDINKAVDQFDLSAKFEDVHGELAPLSSRLGELEDRMYEMALAGDTSSETFIAMRAEAARMRQTIIEVDKQVDILAENKGFSVFGDGVGQVGDSLSRLDFDTAAKEAKALATASSKMTFGTAIKGLKQFGSVIGNLGKALLTNPLFLLVTVIGLIVVGFIKLSKYIKPIAALFEAIGDAIGWVIQMIKDFLDWIGITDFASEDAAAKQIERNERLLESEQKKSEGIIDAMEHEIDMRRARGEETEEIERDTLKAKIEAARIEAKLLADTARQIAKLHGLESDEFKEAMKNVEDAKKSFREAIQEIEVFDAGADKRAEEREKKSEAERKAAADKAKAYAADRLAAERQLEDLRLSMIADENERELAMLDTQYQRKIENTKNNEKLLASEKAKIIEALELEAVVKRAELEAKQQQEEQTKEQQEEQARLAKLQEQIAIRDQLELELIEDQFEREKLLRQAQFDEKIADLEEKGLLTNEIEKMLAQQLVDDLAEIDKKAKEEEDARNQEQLEKDRALQDAKLSMVTNGLQLAADVAELFAGRSEQAALVAFRIQKAASLAQATMDGYRAVLSTYAQTPGGPVVKGIAAGVAGAFAAVQIAKIAQQQFQAGAGGGATPSGLGGGGGGGGAAAPAAQAATPNFELFGQANNINTFFQPEAQEQQTPTVIAKVSMNQLSTTEDRLAQIEENGEL